MYRLAIRLPLSDLNWTRQTSLCYIVCMGILDSRIEQIKRESLAAAESSAWYLRCDQIRLRERTRNYEAVKSAAKSATEKVRTELSDRKVEFSENPAGYFTVRDPAPDRATVTVAISGDGAVLEIERQSHSSTEAVTKHIVRIRVVGDDTELEYEGRMVTAQQLADALLLMIL
jgi:hypothetical protein